MRYILLIMIFVAIGCKKDIYSGIAFEAPIFKDSVYVKTEVLNDTIYTKLIANIYSYKDYIILFASIDDHLFHFLDKNTGTIVKSFGSIGRGPQEILPIFQGNVNEEQGVLTSYQQATKEIYVFHLDSVLQNKKHIIDKISLQKYKDMTFYGSRKCQDGFLLSGGKCIAFPGGARFSRFSDQGELIDTYDEYPINSRPASDSINKLWDWSNLRGASVISPDGKRLAAGTEIGGIMEILRLDDKIKSDTLRGYYKPQFRKQGNEYVFTEETRFCFYYMTASNNYLYVLSFDSNTFEYMSTDIQVYDWQGNPVKKYKTDRPLQSICVDEKRGKVYAISMTPEREQILISFKL